MKVPLRYQISEFDCATMSLFNAFNYVLEREEIPAIVIKEICANTLDCFGKNGHIGEGGTSKNAINKFVKWFNKYNKNKVINLNCDYLKGKNITLDKLKDAINNGGCILARCYQTVEHYVIITKITEKYVYLFDPYYINKKVKDSELKIIKNNIFAHNRRITIKRLFEETKNDFALGKVNNRECVLFYKS